MLPRIFSSIVFLFAAILILNSCANSTIPKSKDLIDSPVKVIHYENGDYLLKFKKDAIWEVYTGTSRKEIDWTKPIAKFEGTELLLSDIGKNKRIFFGIKSERTAKRIVSERRIPLQNQPNLRDIGGLETKDGRRVKWGKIYRSGKLSDLEKSDHALLTNLGIKTVCDFRSDVEQEKHPNNLPAGIRYIRYPIGEKDGKSFQKLRKDVLKKRLKGKDAEQTFVKLMEAFADSVSHDFQPVLDLLLVDGNEPLIYHCSGGKDRTGFMTAVILAAMDVDMKTIRQDYLMSNYYRQRANQKKIRQARLIGLDQETLEYLFIVRDSYFDSVINTVNERYGDMDNYLAVKFGLTREVRDQLKEKYTYEPDRLELEKDVIGTEKR
ncbi:MAG: protein-tyrosine phosphatase [Paraglaciecola sp.]|jgi:protein-tyrosine phosphatase